MLFRNFVYFCRFSWYLFLVVCKMKIKLFLIISGIVIALMLSFQYYLVALSVLFSAFVCWSLSLKPQGKPKKLHRINYWVNLICYSLLFLMLLIPFSIDVFQYNLSIFEESYSQARVICLIYFLSFISTLMGKEFDFLKYS